MHTIVDESFGIVPIIKINDEWQVLLINQISYRGQNDKFWTFPKGHREDGESNEETAFRELKEETNVTEIELEKRKIFTMQYSFQHEGKAIDKTVSFYIGYCKNTVAKIKQPQEIADLKWCSFSEALELLAHKNSQNILKEVDEFLRKNNI